MDVFVWAFTGVFIGAYYMYRNDSASETGLFLIAVLALHLLNYYNQKKRLRAAIIRKRLVPYTSHLVIVLFILSCLLFSERDYSFWKVVGYTGLFVYLTINLILVLSMRRKNRY
jgi:hypothetical protein